MATVGQKIVNFFGERGNKPVSFYTLMGARLTSTNTLARWVETMLAGGELVEVHQAGLVYVRLRTENDDEPIEPDFW